MEGILMVAASADLLDDETEDVVKKPAPKVSVPENHHLKPIIVNRQKFVRGNRSFYRIYTTAKEYKLVEADSAHEAYTKSGVSRAYKIERESFHRYISLEEDLIEKTDETVETNLELPDPKASKFLIDEFLSKFEGKYDPKDPFEEMGLPDLARLQEELKNAPVPSDDMGEEHEDVYLSPDESALAAPIAEPQAEPMPQTAQGNTVSAPVESDDAEVASLLGDVSLEEANGELSIDEVTKLLGGGDDDDPDKPKYDGE